MGWLVLAQGRRLLSAIVGMRTVGLFPGKVAKQFGIKHALRPSCPRSEHGKVFGERQRNS